MTLSPISEAPSDVQLSAGPRVSYLACAFREPCGVGAVDHAHSGRLPWSWSHALESTDKGDVNSRPQARRRLKRRNWL